MSAKSPLLSSFFFRQLITVCSHDLFTNKTKKRKQRQKRNEFTKKQDKTQKRHSSVRCRCCSFCSHVHSSPTLHNTCSHELSHRSPTLRNWKRSLVTTRSSSPDSHMNGSRGGGSGRGSQCIVASFMACRRKQAEKQTKQHTTCRPSQ